MYEAGQCRRKADGSFEFLRSQSISTRDGYVEVWEPAATHAAKHMPLPESFLRSLREAGLQDGEHLSLYDLLVLEGWTPPRGYIELVPDRPGATRTYRDLPAGEIARREIEAADL